MTTVRLVMVIDLKRCIGCHTCAVSCKLTNNLPDGTWWNRVLTMGGKQMDTPQGIFPNLGMQFITVACQHCDNPACVKACPVGATQKREADGVVTQDYDKCIGCRSCMTACPYDGVRQFNASEPRYAIGFPVGDANVPRHQKHVVGKCVLCPDRLARGESPACVESCPARARHFGNLSDPESEVSRLLRSRASFRLLVERGTEPSIYFLT
jgi:dimethyl sulfoxide reductase iron-sulfur subunit